jgi:hypothetical protein
MNINPGCNGDAGGVKHAHPADKAHSAVLATTTGWVDFRNTMGICHGGRRLQGGQGTGHHPLPAGRVDSPGPALQAEKVIPGLGRVSESLFHGFLTVESDRNVFLFFQPALGIKCRHTTGPG